MTALSDLLTRLEHLTANLSGKYRELGTVQATEARNKAEAWRFSEETTVNGRREFASAMVADTTAEALELKSDIAALEVERDFLVLHIDLITKGFVDSPWVGANVGANVGAGNA